MQNDARYHLHILSGVGDIISSLQITPDSNFGVWSETMAKVRNLGIKTYLARVNGEIEFLICGFTRKDVAREARDLYFEAIEEGGRPGSFFWRKGGERGIPRLPEIKGLEVFTLQEVGAEWTPQPKYGSVL